MKTPKPQPPKKLIARPSIQSLLLEMRFDGTALATGTGFVVTAPKGPVLITNRHNVTGRNQETNAPLSDTGGIPNEIQIQHNHHNRLGVWIPKIEPLLNNAAPLWVEHPTLGARADFVALPLTQLDDVQLYPYALGDENPPITIAPAEIVSVVGFPFGLTAGGSFAIWATGFVASDPALDYDNLPVFLIDCRSRKGQSGSAVIAYRAGGAVSMDKVYAIGEGPMTRFLGIYSGRVNEESDLGLVWKETAIQELIAQVV